MDRRQFFGDSIAGTILRLVVLSIVVGIVFRALNITPENLVETVIRLVRNIYDLGFRFIGRAFDYFLIGAVVVIPVWFVVRLLSRPKEPRV